MNSLRKLIVVAALSFIAMDAVEPALTRKVNEYEGQHRIAAETQGDPSQWGVAGDPSQWGVAGDPSQW